MKEDNKYKDDKFLKLDSSYVEPYHYYVNFKPFTIHKEMSWGLEYYCYVEHVLNTIKELGFSTLLDVGCGDGFILNYYGQEVENYESMTGVDLSEKAIVHANAFKRSPKVNFVVKDVAELNTEYDIVTLIEVMEHIGDEGMTEFMTNIKKRTKKGGHIVITVPSVNVELNPTHHRHYTLELLKEHVGEGVELVSYKYLFKRNFLYKLINGFLANRFFIMRHRGLLDFLFNMGHRCFDANKNNGVHVFAVFRKVVD